MPYSNIDKPSKYFNTKLYTGNGSTQTITGLNFAPEWVWLKDRTSAYNHAVFDKVRGAEKRIFTNLTNAEDTASDTLTAFNSDGFTLGSNVGINTNSNNYVSWNWDANGAGVSNNSGTITSTVSANTTSGFSIVSYTGNGSSSATVGHGLGVTPAMIILKARAGTNAANNWFCWHKGLSANNNISLNSTSAQFTTATASSGIINTSPTSTTFGFTAGSGGVINVNETSTTYIAYCFAEVKGFSKFGSYTGNGSTDGTFVYTGFKPAFVMLKASSSTSQWGMLDNKRNTFNPTAKELQASLSDAETDYTNRIDILSNGFKLKTTTSQNNSSGVTYIYMAFAEQPLVGTNNVPATAI